MNIKTKKILSPILNNLWGYYHVDICMHGEIIPIKIHRLVATAFIPNIDNKPTVDHIITTYPDGIGKAINTVHNLRWATYEEQQKYAVQTGAKSGVRGSKNHLSKYTENTIHDICKELVKNKSIIDISEDLNVPYSLVTDIVHKNSWTHISNLYNFDIIKLPKKRRKLDKNTLFKIFNMRENGYTYDQISDAIDNIMSPASICSIMYRPGSYQKEKEEYASIYK